MAKFTKHLTIAALIAAVGAAGTAIAQTAYTDPQDSNQVSTDTDHGTHMLHFKDQGVSPETDPAAHLLLIKDTRPMETAVIQQTTQTTTVADATPAPAPAPVDTAPAPAADTSTATTDTTPEMSTADQSMPAPKADRN